MASTELQKQVYILFLVVRDHVAIHSAHWDACVPKRVDKVCPDDERMIIFFEFRYCRSQ